MTFTSIRRALAGIVAVAGLAVPTSAFAMPDVHSAGTAKAYSPPATAVSDAAQSGARGTQLATSASDAAQSGARGSSLATSAVSATTTFPSASFRGGDSPVDHPGASRAQPVPTTVEVVQPERTIVRDVDEALPIVLAGTALLLALAMLAVMITRTGLVPRLGRGH